MAIIGTNKFLIKNPLLWAVVVFVLTEFTMLALFNKNYSADFNSNSALFIIILILKLGIFVGLAFLFKFFWQRKSQKV